MAAALGVEFFDEAGKQMIPTGESLRLIEQIRFNHLHPRIKSTTFIAMCDTTNPLCGQNGASVVFGPQKGADETMVGELDLGLMHLADIIEELLGIDFRNIGGTGAGGGLGFGALVFLGGILQSGIETFLQIVDFDALAGGADLIFTGEGKIDKQSLQGKVIDGVTSHSKKLGIPVIVIAGDIGEGIEDFYSKGVAAILSTNRIAAPYNQIISRAKSDISLTLDTFLRIFNLCKRIN
jgi:glycerate kinase